MRLDAYLDEVEYAVKTILEAVWRDREVLGQLDRQIARLEQQTRLQYGQAASVAADALDPDDAAHATGMYWETYFGVDKERHERSTERDRLEARRATREFSLGALATALLQLARQGISLAHGGLNQCPDGRFIGSQALKAVIWQGRNQAVHWEEGSFKPPVDSCFMTLATEIDDRFSEYQQRNLAFDLIDVLGWHGFTEFARDLRQLA